MAKRRRTDRRAASCCWCGATGDLVVVRVDEALVVTVCRWRCAGLLERAREGDPDQAFMLRALDRRSRAT